MTANPLGIALNPAAHAFVTATDAPPYLYELPPEAGRAAVDDVQSARIEKPAVTEECLEVPGGPTGHISGRRRPAA